MHEQLSAWVDGDLHENEVQVLQKHLDQCEACRQIVEDLRALKSTAATLADSPIQGDGWCAVKMSLHQPRRFWSLPLNRRNWARWTIALAASLVAVLCIMMIMQKREEPLIERARVELALMEGQQQRTIAALEAVVKKHRPSWDAKLKKTFVNNLAIVDAAIAECRAALKEHPQNLEVRTSLMAAYHRKVEFLKLFTQIEGTP